MPTRNLTISNLWQLVTVDANNLPLLVKNTYIPPPTIDGLSLGGVKQGTNITITADGTISSSGGGGGGGTLQSLTDVSIVEPTLVDTGNAITNVTPTTIAVSANPPFLLSVGDWIRGDAIANGPIVQITAISANTITVSTTVGFGFLALSGIFKISSITLGGFVLTWDVATNKWIAKSTYSTIQNSVGPVLQRPTIQFIGSGVTSVVDDSVNKRTVVTITGGGGGGAFTSSAVWTGGTSNKFAYLAPGVVNNVGITISLVASSGAGGITNARVSLNGIALPNTYVSTTTWPNISITIPVADLIGNPAEIAPSVVISLVGTFAGSGVNLANAGTLTNTQPTPFTTTLRGSYAVSTTPFYTTTGTLNYSYSNTVGIINTYGGIFTPGGLASVASASFTNIVLTGSVISGEATGSGLNGGGVIIVPLSGSVPAVPIYVPAFYTQTNNSTVPTFTTATTQTPRAGAGSTITYAVATAFTQYVWLCVDATILLSNIKTQTPFGPTQFSPDVGPIATTIAGRAFTIYGLTSLSTNDPVQLIILA